MKQIPNKLFVINAAGKAEPVSVAKLLLQALNTPPQGGFDLATIRARNRVSVVAESVDDGGTISLEDADFQTAKEAVAATKWSIREPFIVEFSELFGL